MNNDFQLSKFVITLVLLFLIATISLAQDNQEDTNLQGPYMGQNSPGLEPQRFAGYRINGDLHGCPVFTPDGLEAYWSIMDNMSMKYSKVVDDYWTDFNEFEFPIEMENSDVPYLTSDGNRLFFISWEPISPEAERKENIWFMDREGDGWNTPQPLGDIVNKVELIHWQLSVADNGNLYFGSYASNGGDILLSRFVDGKYTEPEVLGPSINTSTYDYSPFIAPDESYLIFSRIESNQYANLYISFKQTDSTWTEAVPMEELNTNVHEMCPNVTRDGKYLFFLRNTNNGLSVHWVSAKLIKRHLKCDITSE